MMREMILNDSLGHLTFSFSWDHETGTVEGRSADYIREVAAQVFSDRGVVGPPSPGMWWKIKADPLKSPRDMAVLLVAFECVLPDWLAEFLPDPPVGDSGADVIN